MISNDFTKMFAANTNRAKILVSKNVGEQCCPDFGQRFPMRLYLVLFKCTNLEEQLGQLNHCDRVQSN